MPRRSHSSVPDNWYETALDQIWLPPDEHGQEEALYIRRRLHLRRGQKVLDAPCGAGRIAVHVARAGCRVTGVDLRPQFVERAHNRFRLARVRGRFRSVDLRDIDYEAEFHGIYNWFGSFGYFSDEENAAVVDRLTRALRPGGRLLIEQVNRERILRDFRSEGVVGTIVTYNYWDARTQRIINHRVVDGVRDPANSSSMRLYTPHQMEALLCGAGLRFEGIYAFPEDRAFTRASRRMVAVGRKP